jgi:3-deoxy-manno-octulosonate cytidylyltransferase (CMP-KDO synthetase)
MKVVAVIPARLSASRFPRKPLALLHGRPMIEHVYRRTRWCRELNDVYVATCDREIFDATVAFGGKAVMTSDTHVRASDRVAEVARNLDADVVLMVQGDEPMIQPSMIEAALRPLREDPTVQCVNLAAPITTEEELGDRNTIKVVFAENGDALFFSREPIPTRQQLGFNGIPAYKQVCVIPFRRQMLLDYASMAQTPLERAESVDMLRLLENGCPVRMVVTDAQTHAVDSPADLATVEALLADDPVLPRFLSEAGQT